MKKATTSVWTAKPLRTRGMEEAYAQHPELLSGCPNRKYRL